MQNPGIQSFNYPLSNRSPSYKSHGTWQHSGRRDLFVQEPEKSEAWQSFSAKDLEILSDIILLATNTVNSTSARDTPFPFLNVFRAYDVVLRTRGINPGSDPKFYPALLQIALEAGESLSEKFNNVVRRIGLSARSYAHDSMEMIEADVSPSAESTKPSGAFHSGYENSEVEVIAALSADKYHMNGPTPMHTTASELDLFDKQMTGSLRVTDSVDTVPNNTTGGKLPLNDSTAGEEHPAKSQVHTPLECFRVTSQSAVPARSLPKRQSVDKQSLSVYFEGWRNYTTAVRKKRSLIMMQWQQAIHCHQKNLTKRFFYRWLAALRRYLQNRVKKADARANSGVLSDAFNAWIVRSQNVTVNVKKAIKFDKRRVMRTSLICWRLRMREVERLNTLLEDYRRDKTCQLMHIAFRKWRSRYHNDCTSGARDWELKKELFQAWHAKTICSLLMKHNQTLLKERYFAIWRDKCYAKLMARSIRLNFSGLTEETLKERVFQKWKDSYNNYASLGEMVEDDYNSKIMQRAFHHWRRVYWHNKQLERLADRKMVEKYFFEWYSKTYQRWKGRSVDKKFIAHVLQEWHNWAHQRHRERLQ